MTSVSAKKYNADTVIWGKVTIAGYIPHLTIVDPLSHAASIIKPGSDVSILKDTLTHESLKNITDIRLPAFTEEPISLAFFATGLKHFDGEKYDKALHYLHESLPNNPSQYIDSGNIYSFIGLVHVKLEDYDGNGFWIRQPLSAKEISKLHQLFLDNNLPVNFRSDDHFIVAISERGYIIGGLFYKYTDKNMVYMDKIVYQIDSAKKVLVKD